MRKMVMFALLMLATHDVMAHVVGQIQIPPGQTGKRGYESCAVSRHMLTIINNSEKERRYSWFFQSCLDTHECYNFQDHKVFAPGEKLDIDQWLRNCKVFKQSRQHNFTVLSQVNGAEFWRASDGYYITIYG